MVVSSFFLIFLWALNLMYGKTFEVGIQEKKLRNSQNCPTPFEFAKNSRSFIQGFEKPSYPQSFSSDILEWDISLSNINTIFLNKTMPRYAIILSDIKINETLEVCLLKDGKGAKKLEFWFPHATNLDNYILYEGGDVPYVVGPLNNITFSDGRGQKFSRIESFSGCFRIMNIGDTEQQNIVLFRWIEIQSKNCTFPNIWASSVPNPYNEYLTSDGNCEVIILAKPSTVFSLLFRFISSRPIIPFVEEISDGSNKSYTLKNTLNDKVILEFNQNELSNLKNLLIYSPAVSLILPGSIAMKINYGYGVSSSISVCNNGQKGILVSPSYSGMRVPEMNQQPLFEFKSEYAFELTTIFLPIYISENETVMISDQATDENYTLTSFDVNESQNISGNNLKVFYSGINHLDDYFVIEYTVYFGAPIPESPSTTMTTMDETTEAKVSATISITETIATSTSVNDNSHATNTLVSEVSTENSFEIIPTATDVIKTTKRNSASKLFVLPFFYTIFFFFFS